MLGERGMKVRNKWERRYKILKQIVINDLFDSPNITDKELDSLVDQRAKESYGKEKNIRQSACPDDVSEGC